MTFNCKNYKKKINHQPLFHSSGIKLQVNYRNHIALNLATAHPHYDDEGNTYNMGTAIMGLGRPKYVIFKVPPQGAGKKVWKRKKKREIINV